MCPLASSSTAPLSRPQSARANMSVSSSGRLSSFSNIPSANFSAGRKTLNSSVEYEMPRRKLVPQIPTSREEDITRRAKCGRGSHANDESKDPPMKLQRKRPTSASYESRNVVVDPPPTTNVNRRKVITPTRERPSPQTSTTIYNSDLDLRTILAIDTNESFSKDTKVSDFEKRGRKNSPMAFRTSFEGSSFANVKAEASKELIPSTNYWRVPNLKSIELKPRARPQSSSRAFSDSVASLLKWD